SVQGSAFDHSNGTFSIGAIINFGTPGTGQTSATVQIEECATTNGTFTAISDGKGGTMVTTLTGTVAKQVVLRGLRSLQYVRANAITVAGTTPSLPIGVEIVEQARYVNQAKSGFDNYPST